jgi:hypothetical protein
MNSLESYGGSHDETGGREGHWTPAVPRFQDNWILPTTRHEADERIIELSHDIGLILAQLSEDQASWCVRTGRDPVDYLAWRRRALFAKAHKEHQLRDCKRVRAELSDQAVRTHGGDSMSARVLAELTARAHRVIGAWQRAECQDASLEAALADLAALFTPPPIRAEPGCKDGLDVVPGGKEGA